MPVSVSWIEFWRVSVSSTNAIPAMCSCVFDNGEVRRRPNPSFLSISNIGELTIAHEGGPKMKCAYFATAPGGSDQKLLVSYVCFFTLLYSTLYGHSIDNLLIINFFTYIEYFTFCAGGEGFSPFRSLFVSGLSVFFCLNVSPLISTSLHESQRTRFYQDFQFKSVVIFTRI